MSQLLSSARHDYCLLEQMLGTGWLVRLWDEAVGMHAAWPSKTEDHHELISDDDGQTKSQLFVASRRLLLGHFWDVNLIPRRNALPAENSMTKIYAVAFALAS